MVRVYLCGFVRYNDFGYLYEKHIQNVLDVGFEVARNLWFYQKREDIKFFYVLSYLLPLTEVYSG